MPIPDDQDDVLRRPIDRFTTTHWSVVLAAKGDVSSEAHEALEELCRTYWYALYAYVRRSGYTSHDAEELTQEFLTRFVEREYLRAVDRDRGKFRSFLLAAMKHFLSNERERAGAKKRGGGRALISLDFRDAETHYRLEPSDKITPERLYDRRWALTLLDGVMVILEQEYAASGKAELFAKLRPCLTHSSDSLPYREIAQALSLTEGAVKTAVHRLRRKYRRLLKRQISQTVDDPDDIEDELRDLFIAVQFVK